MEAKEVEGGGIRDAVDLLGGQGRSIERYLVV
jgi:hypothetical protein